MREATGQTTHLTNENAGLLRYAQVATSPMLRKSFAHVRRNTKKQPNCWYRCFIPEHVLQPSVLLLCPRTPHEKASWLLCLICLERGVCWPQESTVIRPRVLCGVGETPKARYSGTLLTYRRHDFLSPTTQNSFFAKSQSLHPSPFPSSSSRSIPLFLIPSM